MISTSVVEANSLLNKYMKKLIMTITLLACLVCLEIVQAKVDQVLPIEAPAILKGEFYGTTTID